MRVVATGLRSHPAAFSYTGPWSHRRLKPNAGYGAGMTEVSRISSIWRYPVKSMLGERVAAAADIGEYSLHADRTWAVRDVELDVTTGAKAPSRSLDVFRPAASIHRLLTPAGHAPRSS